MPQARIPPKGHIWLGLSQKAVVHDGLYLNIPIGIIHRNCLHPIKYLRYLAWCILCREGEIKSKGLVVADNDRITDRGVYSFALQYEYDEDENGDDEDGMLSVVFVLLPDSCGRLVQEHGQP